MYLSRKYKNIYSLLYSLIIIIIGYVFLKIDEMLIVMLIGGIYFMKSIYTVGIINIFLAIILITKNTNNPMFYILIKYLARNNPVTSSVGLQYHSLIADIKNLKYNLL